MNKSQSGKPPNGTRSHSQGADKIDEQNRPYLIHPSTYMILAEQIMTLMPAERNIILTMNEYEISDINPTHPQTDESPTHIIMFCIRFLSDGLFQPIGALLIYKYENQSKILAECLKAYINDLWKIGLYVMATVSPPFETFKSIMCHLAGIQNFNFYSGVISYSVAPFKEIIHIYDVQFLLIKLQNLFKESDIRFEESYLNQKRYYQASWLDIDYVLTSSKEFKLLSEYFTFNKEVPRRVHIFSEQIYVQLMEAESQGNLSSHADGSLVLLNCIRTFLKFLEQDLVDVQTMTEIHYWDCLLEILQTMQFQKSQCRTCNKETPFNKAHVLKNTSIRRRIDFENDNKEEKQKIGKSRSRKKRKKMNKQTSESHKSQGTNIREQALSKILSDDTTVTVHFLNSFESARSQSENCDIDKNNNSSSDDCPKVKPNKITKKKWKLKNIHKSNKIDDGGRSKTETSDSKGPLKYPRISLKDFSRLSAEDENLLNHENLLNSSRQNVLNNSDSVKEVTTSGGCLKKSISDILNSLNNVQFYSNLCAKNTNVDSQSVKNENNEYVRTKDDSKTCDSDNYVKNQPYEKMSPSNEYLLTNKPKSYGTVPIPTITNPFTFNQDLSQIDLNESKLNSTRDEKNLTKANISDCNILPTPTKSNPFNAFDINKTKKTNYNMSGFPKPKSNISDLIISGTDLSGPNLSKFDLNRPNLSHLDQGESKLTEHNKISNESNVNNICVNDTVLSCSNWPQFDVSRSKLDPLNPRQTEKEKNTNEFVINNFSTNEGALSRPKFGYIGSSNTRQLKSNTNMDKSVVNRPSLSFLESIESRQMENYRNIKEMCPDNQNLPQSDLNNAISKLNINDTESDANYINSPVRTESNSLSTSTETASPSDMGKMTSLTDDEHSDSIYSKSVLNFSKNYANSNSQISYRNQVEKRTSDSYGSNKNRFELSNSPFEFGRQNSTNFDLTRQNSINLDLNRQNSTNLDLSRQNSTGYDFNNRTNSDNFNLNNTKFSTFDLNRPTTSSFSLNTSQDRSSSSFCETLDFSNDHFCSKSDEETEKSIKASCDNVPNILELLSTVEKSPENIDSNDFETNAVTFELLCTVHGIERLFTLLYQRRVKFAKPDAFIVEHIDFLVTIIKERNMINSAAYYGNGYTLLNTELAFSTLQNNAGLYLVSK